MEHMENNNLDILAIGDITTDAFIRVKEASVNCDIDNENCKICLNFADKIPYEFVKVVPGVGNAANAAVSAARLGLKSALKAEIGNDRNGEECRETLEKDTVNTSYLTVHNGKATNYHYVLWYEDERTILIKHETFEYSLGNIGTPRWVYLSSLSSNSLPYHLEIADYLEKNPEIKLAFQPGTFQIKLGKDRLERLYKRSEIFFCNVAEAKIILETEEGDVKKLLHMMRELGPKIVVITDGPKGAYVYNGEKFYFMPTYPDIEKPKERTGAGDALASTITSALALGLPLEEALRWGPINSMSVVQGIGAQEKLLTRSQLEEYLKSAPSDYFPKEI